MENKTQQQPKQPELQPANDQPKNQVVKLKGLQEETFNKVMEQITAFQEAGDLKIPKDYAPQNALRAAWLMLQDDDKKPLEKCTKLSICNAMLKMVVWGLSPLKKQGDFIAYGDKLTFSPEYTGNIVLAKRYGKLKDYNARAIFKGDVFEFEVEAEFPYRTRITKHEQKLQNIGGEVIGAYFAYELTTGEKDVEIMNINQIHAAWNQGAMRGNSGAHKNFSDQMAIKTVINRGCKLLIRGSDDSALMMDDDEEERPDPVKAAADLKKKQAKKEEVGFTDAEVVKDEPKEQDEPNANDPKPEF